MPDRLFGTDGVRGRAGEYPLDPPTVARLGAALVRALHKPGDRPRLLFGRDPRESGTWIERELVRGATAEGARCMTAGVMPTPAIAFLTRSEGFDAGIVISASHNPYGDNGVKVFSGQGEKLTQQLEEAIEAVVADSSWAVPDAIAAPAAPVDLSARYIDHLRRALPGASALGALRVALDCANGATSEIAPRVFRELGFDVTAINCTPDGRNINANAGSTHPEALASLIQSDGYRLGVAFDGDGDRAIFVDDRGRIVDGDAVLFMCAKQMKATGRLRGDAVVATVMSNVGLEVALRDLGVELIRCPVGDKYVMEELARRNLSLGGEQSGHVIFTDRLFTGDGLVTALSVLEVMAETGRELAELAGDLTTFPQVLVNVRVAAKKDLRTVPEVSETLSRVEERIKGQGRVLVRYSGTEPLLRVMIEGREQAQIEAWAEEIAAAARRHLGAAAG